MKQIVCYKVDKGSFKKGDVVDIVDEKHILSRRETEIFDIFTVTDEEVEKIKSEIKDHKSKSTKVSSKAFSIESYDKVKMNYKSEKMTWQIE